MHNQSAGQQQQLTATRGRISGAPAANNGGWTVTKVSR
jgi:hypothetical protein